MNDTETPAGDGSAPEVWVYAGVRVSSEGKQMGAWVEPSGRVLRYREKGSFVIGGLYSVEARRDDGHTYRSDPQYTGGRYKDEDQRLAWAALDRAARTRLAAAARERSAIKRDELAAAVDPLVAIARKLRTQADRDALAAYVLRQINRAW